MSVEEAVRVMTKDTPTTLNDVVNLDRYPIDDLGGVCGRRLVESCRKEFSQSVLLELPDFLMPNALHEVLEGEFGSQSSGQTQVATGAGHGRLVPYLV